jgi:hypothetical protein
VAASTKHYGGIGEAEPLHVVAWEVVEDEGKERMAWCEHQEAVANAHWGSCRSYEGKAAEGVERSATLKI